MTIISIRKAAGVITSIRQQAGTIVSVRAADGSRVIAEEPPQKTTVIGNPQSAVVLVN